MSELLLLYDGDPLGIPLPAPGKSWEMSPTPGIYVIIGHDRLTEGLYSEATKFELRHKIARAFEHSSGGTQRSWYIERINAGRPSISDWTGGHPMDHTDRDDTADPNATSSVATDDVVVQTD